MQQVQVNIYKFNELPEDVKEKVLDNWRNNTEEHDWSDGWVDSLKEFCRVTGIDLKDYSIGPYSYSSIDWNFSLDEIELTELKGLRLRTWLINNWLYRFGEKKYIGSLPGYYDKIPFIHNMIKWTKLTSGPNKDKYYGSKYFNLFTEYNDCPLTGVCSDMDLIQSILDFIKTPKDNISLDDIIEDCMNSFITGFNSDMEYQDSDEYIIETIEANEYDFTIDGKIY